MSNSNRIIIPSSLNNLHAINKFVEDICDRYKIFNSYFSNILMAVTEAVANAIVHGNHDDTSKHVEVHFRSKSDGLYFTISDQGMGFNPDSLPDPTNPESDGESGRGLYLMKALSDEMTFSDGGSTIELFFSITGIDREIAMRRKEKIESYLSGIKRKTKGESIK